MDKQIINSDQRQLFDNTENAKISLRKVNQYFSKMKINLSPDNFSKSVYFIDWDLLRQVGYENNKSTSFFSSIIYYSLLNCRKIDIKIFIPEGAKREIYNFLLYKRRHQFKTKKSNKKIEKQLLFEFERSDKGVYKSNTWVPNEKRTYILEKADRKLTRLDSILKDYTANLEKLHQIPALTSGAISNTSEFNQNYKRLNEIRPGATTSNYNDAINLAYIDLCRNNGLNAYLITGTKILHSIHKDAVIDPIYFLLLTDFIHRFSKKGNESLRSHINKLQHHFGNLGIKTELIEDCLNSAQQHGYQTTQGQLDQFRQDLELWLEDVVIVQVLDIFSRAVVDAKNKFDMVKSKNKKKLKAYSDCFDGIQYKPAYTGKIDNLIEHIFSGPNKRNIKDIGYRWTRLEKGYRVKSKLKMRKSARTILTLKCDKYSFVTSWDTLFEHNEIFSVVYLAWQKQRELIEMPEVAFLYDDQPTRYYTLNSLISENCFKFNSITTINAIRFLSKKFHILYRLGDEKLKTTPTVFFSIPASEKDNSRLINLMLDCINNSIDKYLPLEIFQKSFNNQMSKLLRNL